MLVHFLKLLFSKRTGLQAWTKLNGPFLYSCPKRTTTEIKWTSFNGPFFYTSILRKNWFTNMDQTWWSIFVHLSQKYHNWNKMDQIRWSIFLHYYFWRKLDYKHEPNLLVHFCTLVRNEPQMKWQGSGSLQETSVETWTKIRYLGSRNGKFLL